MSKVTKAFLIVVFGSLFIVELHVVLNLFLPFALQVVKPLIRLIAWSMGA
jgi:hypothetical protein